MNYNPPASILIPAWEDEKVLQDTLNAVQQVEYPLDICELIIVAGGGDTISVARNFDATVFSECIVLQQEIGDSKSGALIKGLKVAKNEIIVLLDADTIVSKLWLREMMAIFEKGFDAVNGTFYPVMKNNLVGPYFIAEMTYNNSMNSTRLYANATIAFKKEILEKHGIESFFKKELVGSDDFYFMNQLLSSGYTIGIAKNAIVWTQLPTTIRKLIKDDIRWNLSWYYLVKTNTYALINHLIRSLAIFISPIVIIISLLSNFHLVFAPFYITFAVFCLKVIRRLIPSMRENMAYVFYLPVFILIHYIRNSTRIFVALASILRMPINLEINFKGERT